MSDFLLLCVKFFCFLFVMIIVIWKIKVRYDKKNKIKREEKEQNESTESVKYTFSSVFPNKEVMDDVFEIIKQNKETEKKIETANKSEDIDFSLNFSNKVLEVGKTAQIVVNSNINNLNIKYKSFKTDVATVSESGAIKALKKGTTYIEVNVNQRISKVIELVVIDNNKPTSSSINKNNKPLVNTGSEAYIIILVSALVMVAVGVKIIKRKNHNSH